MGIFADITGSSSEEERKKKRRSSIFEDITSPAEIAVEEEEKTKFQKAKDSLTGKKRKEAESKRLEEEKKRKLEETRKREEDVKAGRAKSARILEKEPSAKVLEKEKSAKVLEKEASAKVSEKTPESEVRSPDDFKVGVSDGFQTSVPDEFQTAPEGIILSSIVRDKNSTVIYDNAFDEFGGSLVAGAGDILEGVGEASTWLGAEGLGAQLIEKGGEWQSYQPELTEDLKDIGWEDMYNPRFYTTHAARGVPYVLAMIPLFYVGAAATATAVAGAGITGTGALILTAIGGGALPTAVESSIQAGDVYDTLLSEGKSKKEAKAAADKAFGKNAAFLSVTNSLNILPFLRATKADEALVQSLTKRLAKGVGVAGGEFVVEGSEEVGQSLITERAKGRNIDLADTKGEFIVGGVSGLLFTGGGAVMSKTSGLNVTKDVTDIGLEQAAQIDREVRQRVKDEIPGVQDKIVEKVENGQIPVVAEDEVISELKGKDRKDAENIAKEVVTEKVVESERIHQEAQKEIVPEVSEVVEVEKPALESKPAKVEPTKPATEVKVAPKKEKVVKVPRSQLPTGTGKEKVSRLGARLAGFGKDLGVEEAKSLGLQTFRQRANKPTVQRALNEVSIDDAVQIVEGKIEAPPGLDRQAVFVGLTQSTDTTTQQVLDIATAVASQEGTSLGQRLSILQEANKDSAVSRVSEVVKTRVEAFKERTGKKSVEKEVKTEAKKIKRNIKPPSKDVWLEFVAELQC